MNGQLLPDHRTDEHWVFYGERPERTGNQSRPGSLCAATCRSSGTSKIKGAANPYDPAWEAVLRGTPRREDGTTTCRVDGQLLYLWKEQDGICPVCHQKITELTGWHNHHIVWRTHGGKDTSREPRAPASELP